MKVLDYLIDATVNEDVIRFIKNNKRLIRLINDRIELDNLDGYTIHQHKKVIWQTQGEIIQFVQDNDSQAFTIAMKRLIWDEVS